MSAPRLRTLGQLFPRRRPLTLLTRALSIQHPHPPPQIHEAIGEETIPGYSPHDYHATHPGQLLHDSRYAAITKLGWGCGATAWLAEDLLRCEKQPPPPRYVAIRISTASAPGSAASLTNELGLSHKIAWANPSHPGAPFVRTLIDNFQINGTHGVHDCLVYTPMRETLCDLRDRFEDERFPPRFLKLYVSVLLHGLDYLHSECRLIHTGKSFTSLMDLVDIKEDNILVDLEDSAVLEDFVQLHRQFPLPRHVAPDGHTSYLSQSEFGPLHHHDILPELADFDLAQSGEGAIRIHPVQSHRYRAPEVILGTGWSYSADIWNFGVLIWNMMEGRDLFTNLKDACGDYSPHAHLAQMVALLVPPPPDLLRRERNFRKLAFEPPAVNPQGRECENAFQYFGGPFFDDDGEFIRKDLIPQDLRLADTVTLFEGEEKAQFLDFVGGVLQWEPERRSSAKELLEHPFIQLDD